MFSRLLSGPEAHQRSVAKGITWRIVGTVDTVLWSWIITGKTVISAAIGGTEVITKVILYYFHERAWHVIPGNPDGHLRTLVKAVSWRVVGGIDTFIRVLLFTGRMSDAISITTAEGVTKIVLFYLHERAWRLVKWGQTAPAPVTAPPAAS